MNQQIQQEDTAASSLNGRDALRGLAQPSARQTSLVG
jgi:hypothetical protein